MLLPMVDARPSLAAGSSVAGWPHRPGRQVVQNVAGMQLEPSLRALTDDFDVLSDRQLVSQVMDVLTTPPTTEADSFVLHAPLELMARAELLPSVDPARREEARRRIAQIATEWGEHAPHGTTSPHRADTSLFEAIAAGDIDAADGALVILAASLSIDEFVAAAADALLPHLGGAGHLAIFLDQLTRLRRAPSAAIESGRALVRDLARHPDWAIRWLENPRARDGGPTTTFTDVLTNPPSAGELDTNFIHPTMSLVDSNGMAAELLAGPTDVLSVDEARRQLLRIAAMSMLQDDPAHAPYGWSHCLTMPQAALAIAPRMADPRRAVAVAATYVLGFRATLSATKIDLDWTPPVRSGGVRLLDADVDDAVAEAWHTEEPDRIERELATYAASHHDAHLAKYTLACLHAAHDDPDAAGLFRAAATRLALWWRDDG